MSGIITCNTLIATGLVTSNTGFNVSSSIRYKENIAILPDNYNLDMLMKYKPITYESKSDTSGKRYPGLIAEEVADISANYFVEFDGSGNPNSLDYSRINIHLIKCIQELSIKVDRQQKMIEDLQALIIVNK